MHRIWKLQEYCKLFHIDVMCSEVTDLEMLFYLGNTISRTFVVVFMDLVSRRKIKGMYKKITEWEIGSLVLMVGAEVRHWVVNLSKCCDEYMLGPEIDIILIFHCIHVLL